MGVKRKQADHRADTRGGGWNGLPHAVADSPAYLALSPFERAVLNEILRQFKGYNNGDIAISYERLGDRLKGLNRCPPNNARIGRAVARLMEHGLIAEPTPQSWLQRKTRRYRLTFITSGKAPPFKSATNEYLRWAGNRVKKDGDAGSPEKVSSGDAGSPEPNHAGDLGSPDNLKNGSFASADQSVLGDAGSLVIVMPYPPAEKARVLPAQFMDNPTDERTAVLEMRQKIIGYWSRLSPAKRRTWPRSYGIEPTDLQHYMGDDPYRIPNAKAAELVNAIKLAKREG